MWFFCSPSLLTQHPAPCRVWGWTPPVLPQCCKALGWAPHGCRWLHSTDTISCSYFTKTSLYQHEELGSNLGIPAPSGRSWILPDGSQLSCMRWDFPTVPEDLGTQTNVVCRPAHSKQSNQCPTNSVPFIWKLPPAQLGARGRFSGLAHCYVK